LNLAGNVDFNSKADIQSQALGKLFFDAWLKPARFAMILAVLIAAFFPEVLFGGQSFVFRDFGIFTYPNAFFQRESFWHGEMPLWNPLNNCGIPFLAQWNTDVLYPLSLLYILLPFTWGLNLFLLTHLFLAGFGTYLLASQWTKNRLAAAIAGVAFVFNGMTLNCLMWTSNLACLAWMPWVILVVEQAWLIGGRRVVVAALVCTMQMLAGAPEIIVFTWLILFALWVGRMTTEKPERIRTFARVILIVIMVTLLSAAQLLPFLDLLVHSERTSAYGTSVWPIPLWGWANLFVPLFHCYKASLGVYFQPWQDWTSSYYLGVGILTLGLLAIPLVKTPRVWLLAGFAVFGFVVALGNQGILYPVLLKFFPSLGFMRYPIKFAFLTVFTVPVLAAYTVAWFGNSDTKSLTKRLCWPLSLIILSSFTISGILWHVRLHPFPRENWPVLWHNGLFRAVFLVLIVGTVLIYERIQNLRLQMIAGLLMLTFVWLDVVTYAPSQNPTVEPSVFQSGLLAQRLNPMPQLGEARAFMTKQSHDLFYGSELTNLYLDYIGRRCALLGDCNILDDIPVPDGFYSLYVREQRSIFNQLFWLPTNALPPGFADFLGISYISDPDKVLAWQFRPTHLPFYSIGAKVEFVALSNMPALLLQTNFHPRQVVYLPTEAKAFLTATNLVHGTVRATHFAARRLDFETDADAPALLVLSQTYYHPWQAYVDDKPTRLLRANYAFQAVEIPAGHHAVRLVYQDRLFQAGAAISVITFACCFPSMFPVCRKSSRKMVV
jgi:hypothetical protein